MGSRLDLFAGIRRDARVEGLGIRALARKYGVGRDTVRVALSQAEPPPRKVPMRQAPRLGPFKSAIDAMLRQDLDAPPKQRHTAMRVLARLVDEHGASDMSYSTVRDYVRVRRSQIAADAGRAPEVFVPQRHGPGEEAEVDFGEAWFFLDGVKTKGHLFTFRLSHSGKAVHRVFPTESQEAFLEGHIVAFEELGGVPVRHIRYDNLTSAVKQVVFGAGRARIENDRWVLFRSHYGFDAFYCRPGVEGAHEKGGVEGEVGRFRRAWFAPMPQVSAWAELNQRIQQWDARDDARRVSTRARTVGQDYADERSLLRPLPVERFDPGLVLYPRVDRSALVTVRQSRYSVPARLVGRRVRVSLRACELVIFNGRVEVARHERVVTRGGEAINLDHYLEVLLRKPGAFPGSTALAQARESGAFTPTHDAFWQAARTVAGDAAGTRALIDVLLLHRSLPAADVIAGIHAALSVGAVSADVVAVEARLHADRPAVLTTTSPKPGKVVSLTQRRLTDPAAVIAGLPPDTRPLPSVAHYDQLLTRGAPEPAAWNEKEGTTNT
jgi:transposase